MQGRSRHHRITASIQPFDNNGIRSMYIDTMKWPYDETAPINSKNSSWLLSHLTQTACHYIPNIYIYTLDPKSDSERTIRCLMFILRSFLCVWGRGRGRGGHSSMNAEQRINELNFRCIGSPLHLLGRLKSCFSRWQITIPIEETSIHTCC